MRAILLAAAVAAGAALHGPAWAQQTGDSSAMQWLQRVYTATDRLSYTGTFVYQHGEHVETSRMTRIVDASGVHERLETLDGTPREVIRANDEVKCYMPTSMTVKVDRQMDTRPFPSMRLEQLQDLAEHYVIRKGDVERVAGHDCQSITLEPKDKLRYGHKLWADIATGMLVKAKTFNEKHELVEQFTFTQLQIGGRIDKDLVKSKFDGKGRDWRVERFASTEADLAADGWQIRSLPPGYRKVTEMKRVLRPGHDVGQIVVSDGLAAVSIFLELAASRGGEVQLGLSRQGAVNVYARKIEDRLVTVVGEVPAESVVAIANAVEYRTRPR